MMQGWIRPDRLFDTGHLHRDVGVRIENGTVVELGKPPASAKRIAGTLTPGFVDLQVNGGGGVMVNNDPTPHGLSKIADAHHTFGTAAILPTVITDAPDVLNAAAEAMLAQSDHRIVGLHIEGPHIAMARRGTHRAEYIRPLDTRTMTVVSNLRDAGIPVMITLAPEAATLEQISALAETGAVVSLGHTDATAPQIDAAIAAGARCGTHLFNAMSQMTGRAPNTVGALINSHCHVGIICDGHHVSGDMIALALRARPARNLMFLVSDAMATVGGPDTFSLYGAEIALQGGKLVNAEGNLAGAHVTQAEGVKRLLDLVGVDLEEALGMSVSTPAQVIGRPDLATLMGRSVADVIVLGEHLVQSGLPT